MIPSPANFWQAFALSCASQHLQETQQERKKEWKTPAAGQSQTLTCSRRLLAIKSQHCATSAVESCGDACLSIPASSPLKAPRIRQRKRGPLLSLSLLAACVSLCLSIPPLPLCAQLWALTHQLQSATFSLLGTKWLQVCNKRGKGGGRLTCGHPAVRASRREGEGRKSLRVATSSFVLWSPPLSTRVIDGWGSLWPRLVHFALQRVPPSQSQTTARTGPQIRAITNRNTFAPTFNALILCIYRCAPTSPNQFLRLLRNYSLWNWVFVCLFFF